MRNEPTCECIVDGCKNRISALDDQFWCGEHGGETMYEMTDRKGLVAAQKALRQEQHGTKEVQGTPIDENKPMTVSEMISVVAYEQGTDVLGGTEEVEIPDPAPREANRLIVDMKAR